MSTWDYAGRGLRGLATYAIVAEGVVIRALPVEGGLALEKWVPGTGWVWDAVRVGDWML